MLQLHAFKGACSARFFAIAVVALVATGADTAAAQNLPARKGGLWEMRMEMQGMPGGMGSQHCVDPKNDADMQRRAMQGDPDQRCTQKSMKTIAGGFEVEMECNSAEGKAHMTSRATGDFNSAYIIDSKVRFEPPRHGMREATMKVQARHAGACPAGLAPGQVRMQGMPGMPAGMDARSMQGMTPEQARRLADEMKKAAGK